MPRTTKWCSARSKRTGIVFVGFDATDDAKAAIKAGTLGSTVAQQPSEMGRLGVINAVKSLNGQSIPDNLPIPVVLITKDNVNQ